VAQVVLVAIDMSVGGVVRLTPCAIAMLMSATFIALAQQKETITALAGMTSAAGVATSTPLTLLIERFATDAERNALVRAVKKDGTEAARLLLMKRDDMGSLQLGGRTVAVKYVFELAFGGVRLITAMTTESILVPGEGLRGSNSTRTSGLGLVLVEITEGGTGSGEIIPAAGRIRVDDEDAIVTEAYGADNVVQLTNVVSRKE
jgi:hypothetical protein